MDELSISGLKNFHTYEYIHSVISKIQYIVWILFKLFNGFLGSILDIWLNLIIFLSNFSITPLPSTSAPNKILDTNNRNQPYKIFIKVI